MGLLGTALSGLAYFRVAFLCESQFPWLSWPRSQGRMAERPGGPRASQEHTERGSFERSLDSCLRKDVLKVRSASVMSSVMGF